MDEHDFSPWNLWFLVSIIVPGGTWACLILCPGRYFTPEHLKGGRLTWMEAILRNATSEIKGWCCIKHLSLPITCGEWWAPKRQQLRVWLQLDPYNFLCFFKRPNFNVKDLILLRSRYSRRARRFYYTGTMAKPPQNVKSKKEQEEDEQFDIMEAFNTFDRYLVNVGLLIYNWFLAFYIFCIWRTLVRS